MGLDLKKLEQEFHDALAKETKESLALWLHCERKDILNGVELLELKPNNIEVEIVESPITERYCKKGDTGTIRNNQIRVGGAWFPFDERWKVIVTKLND